MSLKAKLEAVIYAAEEPVTLAQLAILFTADALEWKAEQDAAAAAQAAADAEPASTETDDFDRLAAGEPVEEHAAAPVGAAVGDAVIEPEGEPGGEDAGEPAVEAGAEEAPVSEGEDAELDHPAAENAEPEGEAEKAESAEAALKREAKQRDKEVRGILRKLLDELVEEYATDNRGVEIREIAGGYRMATKPECHDAVRAFVKSLKPALKLSLPALETLAVVAYKQPVTAPEVNEIRGVDSSGVFGSLLARKLIATAGRKQVIGRPILYKTTKEFLLRFGLKDVTELPSMEEFEKMAALELEEPEMVSQVEASAEVRENVALEEDAEKREEGEEVAAESGDDVGVPQESSDAVEG